MRPFRPALATALAALALAACGPAPTPDPKPVDTTPKPLEVLGTWGDNYGGLTVITAAKWGDAAVAKFDDTRNFAVTQNAPTDPYNPNKFAKLVWTEPAADGWWLCTVDYGLDTAAAAEASTKTADATAPANAGCGGFGWTRMVKTVSVQGTWDDNYGTTSAITPEKWGTAKLVSFDNDLRFAVTQSPADDPYTANKFSRLEWTTPAADGWWLCTVDYGQETAAGAAATAKKADASNPAAGGCGGFPWTKMVKAKAKLELVGTWNDNYGTTTVITADKWGDAAVVAWDNDRDFAITKNAPNDPYNPSKFAKVVWTEPANDVFWVCIVDYGKDTQAEAAATTKVADATTPAESGCGGFPWTKMTRKP